jgi:DNA-binding NarL/FixJ family response regulator
VLVIEDHTLFAESVSVALRLAGFDVQRLPFTRGAGIVTAAVRARPRIAIVDLDLGAHGDGTDLIAPLRAAGAAVIVVTASDDRVRWGGCLHRGAAAVLSKSWPLKTLVVCVQRVATGMPVTTRHDHDELVDLWRREGRERDQLRERFARLSLRERQVLGDLVAGHTVRDIARLDVVSEATVRCQVKAILSKLEVSSQLTAVALARQVDWHATGRDLSGTGPS